MPKKSEKPKLKVLEFPKNKDGKEIPSEEILKKSMEIIKRGGSFILLHDEGDEVREIGHQVSERDRFQIYRSALENMRSGLFSEVLNDIFSK